MSDFLRFLKALLGELIILITGGGLMAGLTVWFLLTGKPAVQIVNLLVLGMTLLLGNFKVWQKMSRRVEAAERMAAGQLADQLEVNPAVPAIQTIAEMARASMLIPELESYSAAMKHYSRMGRAVVEQSIHELSEPYSRSTELAADAMVSHYIGKWFIVWEQTIQQIKRTSINRGFVLNLSNESREHMHCYFKPEWQDHIEILSRGQRVSVIGQIDSIGKNSVCLESCELIGRDLPKQGKPGL